METESSDIKAIYSQVENNKYAITQNYSNMKKKIFIIASLFALLGFSGQLFGQENINTSESNVSVNKATINTTRSNIKHNKSEMADVIQNQCMVSILSNEAGCDIVFTNQVKSPRDAASGLATGKRMNKPMAFSVNSSDNAVSEIVSPRDAASGLSTGRRSPGNPIGGLTIKGGKNPGGNQFNNLVANNGQFNLPPDCPDGDCDLILSWSWGASNSGSAKTYCQCHFILTMEAGAFMAIKTKGTGASNR